MIVSSTHQIKVFLICIITGILCGMLFDFQRSLRKIYGGGNISTAVNDFAFICACTALAIFSGLRFNSGEIRYYQILGAVCGVLIYAALISSFMLTLFCFVNRMIMKIIIFPIAFICRFIFRKLKAIFLKLMLGMKKQKKLFKKFSVFISNSKKRLKKRLKML